jgi:ribosomal protein L4
LGLDGRVLLILAGPDEAVEKSFRNLPHVKIDYPRNISTYDVIAADRLLFTADALDALEGAQPLAKPAEDEAEGASKT